MQSNRRTLLISLPCVLILSATGASAESRKMKPTRATSMTRRWSRQIDKNTVCQYKQINFPGGNLRRTHTYVKGKLVANNITATRDGRELIFSRIPGTGRTDLYRRWKTSQGLDITVWRRVTETPFESIKGTTSRYVAIRVRKMKNGTRDETYYNNQDFPRLWRGQLQKIKDSFGKEPTIKKTLDWAGL